MGCICVYGDVLLCVFVCGEVFLVLFRLWCGILVVLGVGVGSVPI